MTTTLLLIVFAWMLLLWLAAGLCAAARLGDSAQPQDVPVSLEQEPDTSLLGSGLAA